MGPTLQPRKSASLYLRLCRQAIRARATVGCYGFLKRNSAFVSNGGLDKGACFMEG